MITSDIDHWSNTLTLYSVRGITQGCECQEVLVDDQDPAWKLALTHIYKHFILWSSFLYPTYVNFI